VRVVVAEDTMLTREGIVRLLDEAGVDVVAQAEDAATLIRHVRLERPDAAIVDIRMPPTHTDEGLVAAQEIRAAYPDVGVLVLSHYVEPKYAIRLLEEHPERIGYLLKERVFDVAVLIDALRRIGDGETVVDPTIVARMVGRRAARIRLRSSPTASARRSDCSRRDSRTAQSPPVFSSPSGPWRRT
jgi:DNA-binding NarL/FixJ family response regulator